MQKAAEWWKKKPIILKQERKARKLLGSYISCMNWGDSEKSTRKERMITSEKYDWLARINRTKKDEEREESKGDRYTMPTRNKS